MRFLTYGLSNPGGRDNNEDYFLCGNNIWILADGLGGHECGEIASKTAAEAISRFTESNGTSLDDTFLRQLIDGANRVVLNKQTEADRLKSMRTTLVFAVTDGSTVRYANVGDSRFYYFRNGQIAAQSEDHSVSALSVKLGDITKDAIRTDPDRNKLLKSLGDSGELSVKIPETVFRVQSGDAFLLCSDGLWEYVYETEMETDLAKSRDPKEWLGYMFKRVLLKTRAEDNDNFTAIGVMVE